MPMQGLTKIMQGEEPLANTLKRFSAVFMPEAYALSARLRRLRRIVLALSLGLGLTGCTESGFRKQQVSLHQSLTHSAEAALTETIDKLRAYSKTLVDQYKKDDFCPKKGEGKISSVYYPKSATLGRRADCFVAATKALEAQWRTFYEQSGYVSWIYSYDSDTRVQRILPSANTRLLFGENLIFDTFSFYQEAVLNYPNPAWTKVKEDINGNGRIVMPTQALPVRDADSAASLLVTSDWSALDLQHAAERLGIRLLGKDFLDSTILPIRNR